MSRLKKLSLFLIFAAWAFPCFSQSSQKVLIKSFLDEVLDNEYSVREVAKKYLYFSPLSNDLDKKKRKKRREMLSRHLKEINQKYSSLYSSSTRIIPYRNLRPFQQIPFDKKIVDSVYGVMFTTDRIMYVCLEKERDQAIKLGEVNKY